eukprot:scaffold40316_cov22-Tisochrysis_lutea.AAC.4
MARCITVPDTQEPSPGSLTFCTQSNCAFEMARNSLPFYNLGHPRFCVKAATARDKEAVKRCRDLCKLVKRVDNAMALACGIRVEVQGQVILSCWLSGDALDLHTGASRISGWQAGEGPYNGGGCVS